jgi:hypothetical protein
MEGTMLSLENGVRTTVPSGLQEKETYVISLLQNLCNLSSTIGLKLCTRQFLKYGGHRAFAALFWALLSLQVAEIKVFVHVVDSKYVLP